MTVQELIDTLSEMNPDAKVRFASQPRWAFEYDLSDVVEVWEPTEEMQALSERIEELEAQKDADELNEDDEYHRLHAELQTATEQAEESTVYLVEGTQIGYLPGAVAKQIGW